MSKQNQAVTLEEFTNVQGNNMITYALSLIHGRSVPSFYDGLKPVHRRILWSMFKSRLTSNKEFVKSARVVGNVLGVYHPHSDVATYDALVRMSQWFSNNVIMVDMKGNNGAQNGDPAAAMRYTNAKLHKNSEMLLLDEIEKNAVNMTNNYDNTELEPVILPSKTPMLLVNGSTGIAVGYRPEIPQFNINDVADAVIKVINDPNITAEELVTQGLLPDFSTGGVLNSEGLVEALTTGQGSVVYRVKADIISDREIQITELQHGTTLENLILNIKSVVKKEDTVLPEVYDIKDLSAKGNIDLRIILKKGSDPNVVLNKLYKHTRCQFTQVIILIGTTNDSYDMNPNEKSFDILNVKEIIELWLDFRRKTIQRIKQDEVYKYKLRLHIVEGLVTALGDIDNVIKIIKASEDTASARVALIENIGLSKVQASHIIDMKLSRLTKLGIVDLQNEMDDLVDKINTNLEILQDPNKIDGVIIQDQEDIKEMFKSHTRKTTIELFESDIDIETTIDDEEFILSVSKQGYIKKMPMSEFKTQRPNGKGLKVKNRKGDWTKSMLQCNSKDTVMAFTETGKVETFKVYELEESKRTHVGRSISNYIKTKDKIQTVLCVPSAEFDNKDGVFVFVTERGLVKQTNITEFKSALSRELIATSLVDGDRIVEIQYISNPSDDLSLLISTKNGIALHCALSDVNKYNTRTTQGVKGIELVDDDVVVSGDVLSTSKNPKLFVATKYGLGKKVELSEFPLQNRAGKGRILCGLRDTDEVVEVFPIYNDSVGSEVLLITNGNAIRFDASKISTLKRPAQGQRLINLTEDDHVLGVEYVTN